jgi:hypothetical protein
MLSSSCPEHAITVVQNRGIPDGLVYARDLRGFRRLLLLAWQGNRKTDSVGAPAPARRGWAPRFGCGCSVRCPWKSAIVVGLICELKRGQRSRPAMCFGIPPARGQQRSALPPDAVSHSSGFESPRVRSAHARTTERYTQNRWQP